MARIHYGRPYGSIRYSNLWKVLERIEAVLAPPQPIN